MARQEGVEPSRPGSKPGALPLGYWRMMVLPGGFEPTTFGLRGRRLRQFDYGSILVGRGGLEPPMFLVSRIYSPLPSPLGYRPIWYSEDGLNL